MPVVQPFKIAQEIADSWENEGLNRRPEVIITGHNPAVRSTDILLAPYEESQTQGIGPYVIIGSVSNSVDKSIPYA
jgi:hypothetical protein